MPAEQFAAISAKVADLQAALRDLETSRPEDPLAQLTAVSHVEREAQQKTNLLNLLLNLKGDMQTKLKQL